MPTRARERRVRRNDDLPKERAVGRSVAAAQQALTKNRTDRQQTVVC
jgi:hypothetical protein